MQKRLELDPAQGRYHTEQRDQIYRSSVDRMHGERLKHHLRKTQQINSKALYHQGQHEIKTAVRLSNLKNDDAQERPFSPLADMDHVQGKQKTGRGLLFQQPFSFYVMGDIPHKTIYKGKLEADLQRLNDGQFIVHVGGLNKPSKHLCSKTWFSDVHSILKSSPIPVLAIPGNKDILDCPVNEKGNFNKYFVQKAPNGNLTSNITEYFEDNWDHDHFSVRRQVNRIENWSFETNGILFVGLNMVAQHDLGSHWKLIKDNESWTLSRIQQFNGTSLVMFGNQRPGRALLKPLFEKINRELINTKIAQFLYVHGNGNKYQVEQRSIGHMMSVQIDKGSAAPPLKITVRPQVADEGNPGDGFAFDRRL